MTVAGVDAKFSATWNNPGDFLARIGRTWDATKTYTQLGTNRTSSARRRPSNSSTAFGRRLGRAGWANLGLQLGKMEEAKMLVEVGNGGTGTITFTTATIVVQ